MCKVVNLKAESRDVGWGRTTVGKEGAGANFSRNAPKAHSAHPAKSNRQAKKTAGCCFFRQAEDEPGERAGPAKFAHPANCAKSAIRARRVSRQPWGQHEFSRAALSCVACVPRCCAATLWPILKLLKLLKSLKLLKLLKVSTCRIGNYLCN